MKRLVAMMMCAVSLGVAAQSTITYPYNPDGNADGDIAVGDLQDFLVTYGNPFSPSEIMVGDSSLTYWVEQLSLTVQEQQTELNNLNHPLALAETDIKAFHELMWNSECFDGPAGRVFSVFNPDGDGFLRLAGSNQTDFKYVIVDDSVEVCNGDEAQELFSLRFWEGTLRNMTIPLHQKEKVIFFVHAESIQPEEVLQRNGLFWNALITNQIEPAENNLGPCQGEFTVNYHGYDYELVEIGDQCWFAENLRTDKYLNGDEIPEVTGDEWEDLDEGAWRNWANDESYDAVYGKLYNGYAFNDSRLLCPTGFHSALHYDYLELGAFVGDASHMAYRLKTPSNYGTNDLGFSLKARGYIDDHGNFNWGPNHPSGQFYTSYWVNDPYSWYPSDSDANQRRMEISYSEGANFTWGQWSMGAYVRCIKDTE